MKSKPQRLFKHLASDLRPRTLLDNIIIFSIRGGVWGGESQSHCALSRRRRMTGRANEMASAMSAAKGVLVERPARTEEMKSKSQRLI